MCGRPANASRMRSTAPSSGVAAGDQRERIEIALDRQASRAIRLRRPDRIDRLVEADRIDPGLARISRKLAAGALGEADDRNARDGAACSSVDQPRGRRDHPALELRRRQAARPAVEQLHGLGAGLDLARQIIERDLFDALDDRREAARDRDRPAAAPRPARGCPARRPCRSRPSTALRQTRSASWPGRAAALTLPHGLVNRLEPRRIRRQARRARHWPAAASGAVPRRRRSSNSGRSRTGRSGCRKTGSPHRAGESASAAAA